jgi:Flp pilus assembly protein TadB
MDLVSVIAVSLLATGFAGGLVGLAWSALSSSTTARTGGSPRSLDAWAGSSVPGKSSWQVRRITVVVVVALLVGVLTRWPVAALLAGLAAMGVPSLLGGSESATSIRQVEAVATWTEMLRDTLAGSAGLGQAIVATAPVAPEPIREPLRRLAGRLSAGVATEAALYALAEDLHDETADLVVCALVLASQARAQRLGELLGDLAVSAREQVAMKLRVETSRASTRSGVRTVVVFSLAFAGALAVLAHAYLAPFGSTTGQVVLAVVGACYAAGLALMVRMTKPPPPLRLLVPGGTGGEVPS